MVLKVGNKQYVISFEKDTNVQINVKGPVEDVSSYSYEEGHEKYTVLMIQQDDDTNITITADSKQGYIQVFTSEDDDPVYEANFDLDFPELTLYQEYWIKSYESVISLR